jgi:signal transduction histidine kinase
MTKFTGSIKEVKRSLSESEERLRTLYRCMPIPSVTWQKKGRDFILVDYNLAVEEFTDGLIAGYIGKKASQLYTDRPDIRRDMARSFRSKGVVKRETPYTMFTKGVDKIIDFTFAYIPPDLVLTHMVDNTDRRRTENRLIKSEHDLRVLSVRLLNAGEQERKRIAAELHDSIGQYLTTLKFNAENTLTLLQSGNMESAVKLLEAGIPLVQQTMEEVRRIMMDLRPTILDDLGILATISWFCREFQKTYANLRIRTGVALKEADVPEHLKIIIYRIIQESMNNAASHSQAGEVRLHLARKGKTLELTVQDNGLGFDVDEVMARHDQQHGLGLLSMRERAELGGGRLTIQSAHGQGTTIHAQWPADSV